MLGSATVWPAADCAAMMTLTPRDGGDLAQLDELIDAEANAKQRDRYRAVRLALDGREAEDVAATVGRGRTFVQTWAYRYRDGGLAAVVPRKQPGRKPALTLERRAEFRGRVLAGPTDADGGVCAFRGEDARRILAAEFGVAYSSLQSVYDLTRKLRLSPLRPRPRHRKNDPAAAELFLSTAPLLSKGNAKRTRTGGSRSGSGTRPASASRAR